jgi:hypothetical protein
MPDYPVEATLAGIADGHGEVQEKGLEVAMNKISAIIHDNRNFAEDLDAETE